MGEETRKTGTDHKIMSFQITDEELKDPEMDRYVRESLIREANELEEKINAKPELAGVKAPEGMFESIVAKLKEHGVWEEDDAGEGAQGTTVGKDAGTVPKKEAEETHAAEAEPARRDETAETRVEAARKEDIEDLEALYAKLPEEDQKALALGKEIAQKQMKKERKRRRRKKVFRIAGIAVACLVVVFGISMTSDANRRLMKRMWDGWMVNFGFMVNTDYTGDKETIRSKSKEEIDAMKAISEQLGSPPIDFVYLPEGMEFEGYEITNESDAVLFYSYQDTFFYVTIMNKEQESSYYYSYDNDAITQQVFVSDTGIEANVWGVNLNHDEETYIVEMEYHGWRYMLNGMIPLRELQKIIKYLIIL